MNKPSSRLLRGCLLALGSAGTLTSIEASAQATTSGLEEIIVTAQRRELNLQTTAISASVLTGDALVAKGVTDLYDLQYAAPGVMISGFGSANVFTIRGIGRSQVDIDVPSGVVIYRDGAPTLAGYFQNEPYYDVDNVEVYRGPQGTFVGKSAAGGAVFINTRDPELEDLSGSVMGDVGNYSFAEFTGIVNVPIGDTFAIRAGFKHAERDDFYDSIFGDFTGNPGEVDNNSYRLGFLWAPTDNFSGTLKIDYNDLDFGGNPTSRFGEEPLGNLEQNANFAYTDESTRVVMDLQYETDGNLKFTSLTGYQDVDTVNNLDVNATDPVYYEFGSAATVEIWSQEFNLISPDDQALSWVLGAFYEKTEARIPTWEEGGFVFIGLFNPDPIYPWATSPWDKDEDTWSVFGHVRYDLNEALQLEAGARYSDYEMDQFTQWVFTFDGVTPPDPPPGDTGARQDLAEDSVDWQVALNWTQSEDQFFYGLISRGHITGGVNLFPPFDPYVEMEVINYEVGWKADWADDQFRTQFTVYYEDFDDYQANFAETEVGLNNPTNRNASTSSHLWGVELSGQAGFGNFGLDFGMAYLDSELGDFNDVVDPFRLPPNNVVNLSGAEIPFAPNFTGNIGMQYAFHFADFYLTPRVDVAHTGETQAALWDSPMVTLEERTLVNGLLTFAPESNNWKVEAWITNATDKHYIAGIQNNATLYYAAAPRQYGLRATFNF